MESVTGIWLISVLLSSGTGYIVQQTYSLDFIGDMADDIGKNIQILAGMNTGSKKFNADGFYTWLLLFIVLIVGGYMAYAGLIKRKTTEAVSAAGKYACDLSFNCRVYCLCAAVH